MNAVERLGNELAMEFFAALERRDASDFIEATPTAVLNHLEDVALKSAIDSFRVWIQIRSLRDLAAADIETEERRASCRASNIS